VVVGNDERTGKVLKGLDYGLYLVKPDWVYDSKRQKKMA